MVLAFGLCLLSFAFAMEAKLAWYGPPVGVISEVQASKALPAEMPQVVSHGVPVPDPIHPQIVFVVMAAFTAACVLKAAAVPGHDLALNQHPASTAPYFSASLFFRPPPVR